jgi:hypothetical protein
VAFADLAVRVPIWLALLFWGVAEWGRLRQGHAGGGVPIGDAATRILWTAGAAFTLVHVVLAFHFIHAWSHAAAFADTARQTEAALGLAFGGGVFVNYAFLMIWAADAAWWWLSPTTFQKRPGALDASVRLFILFIFVNGAIVFPSGPVRLLGLLVVGTLGVAWYRGRRGEGSRGDS